ncbi:MAG: L,D-transpeptidase family protein [Rhodobacteraceae bacterium]|nr:L,D-transpeptidase family protein [Paracoccaceae bacterium]
MVVTKWGARFHGRRFPCSVGRGGIRAEKTEGDGISPAGFWCIVGGGFRPDRLVRPPAPALHPIGPNDIWSDDARDPDYNQFINARTHPFSFESLRRADPLYDIVLFSDWNWPDAVPGKGSAIFIHNWRKPRHPTEGCIAFAPVHLRWILARWSPRSRIFVR